VRLVTLLICAVLLCTAGFTQALSHEQLEAETSAQLEQQYDALMNQFWATNDLATLKSLGEQIGEVDKVLTERNEAQLAENTDAFALLRPSIETPAVEVYWAAHRKWCRETPWRRIRFYRRPTWCRP
jgi:hypothetical protein